MHRYCSEHRCEQVQSSDIQSHRKSSEVYAERRLRNRVRVYARSSTKGSATSQRHRSGHCSGVVACVTRHIDCTRHI